MNTKEFTNAIATLALVLACQSVSAEQPLSTKEHNMTPPLAQDQQIPPEVARYLKGPSAQSLQYDFLIGHWIVEATAFKQDGSVSRKYSARWDAQYLNDGRMVLDDFRAKGPNGQDIASFVTLRTWCEATDRWEITGLSAFQPAINAQWYGRWASGEMQMEASGTNPMGQSVKTRIRFFEIQQMHFSWESQTSLDAGVTWHKTASLLATRTQPQ
jgi:hypothetical protein